MREKVLRYIREYRLIHAGDRVAVAVSGGADSVALLRALLELRSELGIVLAVAHFNHGLRGEQSTGDEAFVAELAKECGLEFFVSRADVRNHASAGKLSIEAAGRQLRYRWFTQLAKERRLDSVATAHTADDQAETVLLKFLRGAGTRGLGGIYPSLHGDGVHMIRPLLCVSRAEVETYLAALGQTWREDESNLDRRFLRNRVRHDLLPLLEGEYNPNIRQLLNDFADVARAEEQYWEKVVDGHLSRHAGPRQLSLEGFAELPLALQRRVVKVFAGRHGFALDFEHIERLRACALGRLLKTELPGGRIAMNAAGSLQLCAPQPEASETYEHVLPVPGEVQIPELALCLHATIVPEAFARELPQGTLLKRELLEPQLLVRNWRHGDRYRPARRRSKEKLKKLFADKRIPAAERAMWPVALQGDEIVWVRGLAVASAYEWRGSGDAVKIDVIPRTQ